MINLVKKEACTGCKMCEDICPHHAICFKSGSDGFWFPVVDEGNCTKCGLCISKCPVQNPYNIHNKVQPQIYSAWVKDNKIRLSSTSGGIYYAMANHIIDTGGYIAGCAYSEDFKSACHISGNTKEILHLTMQTKYFQSNTEGIYKNVKVLLEQGKNVFFCGTPCQVAALVKYLPNEYENLITCDLVCHGINSPKAYKAYIDDMEQKFKSKIDFIHMRNKCKGWTVSGTYIKLANGKSMYINRVDDPWFNGYISGSLFLRECCSACQFKSMPRVSDISLGDFWGISSSKENMKKGISLVLINSNKGKRLFEAVRPELHVENKTLEAAISGNRCLIESTPMGPKRSEFFNNFEKEPFEPLVWRLLGQSKWRRRIKKLKYKLIEILNG